MSSDLTTPGEALNNEHYGMALRTPWESDGNKPARNKEPFSKVYVMDAVQEKDDSLVWYHAQGQLPAKASMAGHEFRC